MKSIISFTLAILLTGSVTCFAQDSLLTSIPTTKEEFAQTEKAVIATINWLEQTPLDQETEKRREQNGFLIGWISGAPTVTVNIREQIVPFMKKNPELLALFMGGYTRYCLQNNYSKDEAQSTLAALRTVINVYKKGVGIKKDKDIEKMMVKDEKGELEGWVKDNLGKK